MKIDLTWNVIRYNFNQNKISHFNVFDHGSFKEDVMKSFKECFSDKEKFIEKLRSDAMYYFWSKSEHEIIISPWLGSKDVEKKIDIYYQLRLNWDAFAEYVWITLLNNLYTTKSFLYSEPSLLKVVDENDNTIASTDFNDEESRLRVWKALGLAEEDFYK